MNKIIILVVFIIILNNLQSANFKLLLAEHFNPNNKYGYKTRKDVIKGIFSVIYKSIMKIITNPFSIFSPTPLYLKSPKGPTCNTGFQKQTGLCYKNCKDNYQGKGPICWEKCPSNSKASALSCLIKKSCNKTRQGETCKMVKQGKKTVKHCKPKYIKKCTGPTLKTKKSYGRGVGKIPTVCKDPDTYYLSLGCKEYGIFGKVKNRLYTLF